MVPATNTTTTSTFTLLSIAAPSSRPIALSSLPLPLPRFIDLQRRLAAQLGHDLTIQFANHAVGVFSVLEIDKEEVVVAWQVFFALVRRDQMRDFADGDAERGEEIGDLV